MVIYFGLFGKIKENDFKKKIREMKKFLKDVKKRWNVVKLKFVEIRKEKEVKIMKELRNNYWVKV